MFPSLFSDNRSRSTAIARTNPTFSAPDLPLETVDRTLQLINVI
jgi:hypothetical protein